MPFAGFGDRPLSIAMLGLVEGNGHPYSWSAIFNGYDSAALDTCPYPGIIQYLRRQPAQTVGIPGARVTHVWTDRPEDAPRVAKIAHIPNIVAHPEEVIGAVDAVIIATDIGSEHVARCTPFAEAGLPIFVDKPLVDNASGLKTFQTWAAQGKPILSTSCMAYAKEFLPYRESTHDLGPLRFATSTTMKSWERYGIHALSAIYPVTGAGFLSARHVGAAGRDIVHFAHRSGIEILVAAIEDMTGGFGKLLLCGTENSAFAAFNDTYYAFRAQLLDFTRFLRTGSCSVTFKETEELMRMLIAALWSREQGGREIMLSEVAD